MALLLAALLTVVAVHQAPAARIVRDRIPGMPNRPGWLAAMLDYPPVEPAQMRSPTLWVAGTANEGAYARAKACQPKLAGTQVTPAVTRKGA